MKICLTNLQGLGNSIINFPLIKALSTKHEIDLLTWKKNGSTDFYKEMLPAVNVIGFNSFKEIITWESKNYDMAFALFPAWKREHLSLFFARSPLKVNFWLSNKPYTWPLFKHMPYFAKTPDFEVNAHALETLLKLKLQESDFLIRKAEKRKQIIIHPTASSVYKFYSSKLFSDFINHFADQYQLVLMSGPDPFEVDFCHEILKLVTGKINYIIKPSFNQIVDLLSESEYFLGLDSAIGHLAALCDCRILSLWSFADFNRVPPYAKEAYIFLSQKSMERSWNHPGKYIDCRDISTELDVKKIIHAVESSDSSSKTRSLKYRKGNVQLIYY